MNSAGDEICKDTLGFPGTALQLCNVGAGEPFGASKPDPENN